MYSLNIQGFNWAIVKNSASLLCCILLFACSTTEQVNTQSFSENGYKSVHEYEYEHNYIHEQFYNTFSSQIHSSREQNTQHSDHQLMMSLLNRPIPEDQTMMIALEQERMSYVPYFSSYGVEIKGEKNTKKMNYRANNLYSDLILQDTNSVNITAPN